MIVALGSAIRRILLQPGSGPRAGLRDRRAARGAAALVAARGAAVLLTLVSVPLTLPYLGAERFGLWMTITSLVALMSFADLGLGNGVMTLVAEDEGREDERAAAVHTSSAFFALAGVAAVLGAAYAAVHPLIPWADVYNVASERAVDDAGTATAVVVALFLLALPLGVVRNVQLGCQDGVRRGLWEAAAAGISLVGIVVVVLADGSLPLLAGALAAGPVVAGTFNTLLWFGRVRPALRPRASLVRLRVARELVRIGAVYMLLQMAAMVAFFSDALIVAQILGPEAVTDYSVAWKLFSVVSLTVALALTPLWPAYSEAAASRDTAWVRATLRRSLRFTLVVTVPAAALLLAASGPLISLWSGGDADPPLALLAALAAWTVIGSAGHALAMFYNALKVVRIQLVVAGLMAAVNVGLSIALTHALGIEGVVLGTLISYTIVALLPLGLAVPGILDRLERRADEARAAPAAPVLDRPFPAAEA